MRTPEDSPGRPGSENNSPLAGNEPENPQQDPFRSRIPEAPRPDDHRNHYRRRTPGSDMRDDLEEAFRSAEEFIEHEVIEENHSLGFRVGNWVKEKVTNFPVLGKVVKGTVKFVGNTATKIYIAGQERAINKIVEHPKSVVRRIGRRTIMHHAFQEAMPSWSERLDKNHPFIAGRIRNLVTGVKAVSLFPLAILPATIPFTPIQIPNPAYSIIRGTPTPFLINQFATVLFNAGNVAKSLIRRELLGVIAYGAPGLLDTVLPFFNTVVISPAIDAGISRHYRARAGRFFERVNTAVSGNNPVDTQELLQLLGTDVDRLARHYHRVLGVRKRNATVDLIKNYLQQQQQELQTPTPEAQLIDTQGMFWLKSLGPHVHNLLAKINYQSTENKRVQKLDAGEKLLSLFETLEQH